MKGSPSYVQVFYSIFQTRDILTLKFVTLILILTFWNIPSGKSIPPTPPHSMQSNLRLTCFLLPTPFLYHIAHNSAQSNKKQLKYK